MELNYSNPQGLISRKIMRFKAVSMTATLGSFTLFKPYNGKSFIVTRVLVKTAKTGGTITTQPQFKITDGTNDIVAATTNANANSGRWKTLTVVTDRPATYAAPLTLTTTVAAAGTNPVFLVDILVEGILL